MFRKKTSIPKELVEVAEEINNIVDKRVADAGGINEFKKQADPLVIAIGEFTREFVNIYKAGLPAPVYPIIAATIQMEFLKKIEEITGYKSNNKKTKKTTTKKSPAKKAK